MDEVEELIEDLKCDYTDARKSAAELLGEIKDKRAVSALIKALKDRDRNVWFSVTKALGDIGDPSAVPALLEVLKGKGRDWDEQEKVVQALGKIGDVSAVPVLLEVSKDGRLGWGLRVGAIDALGEIARGNLENDKALGIVPALIEALKDTDVQEQAAWVLGNIGKPVVPALIRALKDESKEVRRWAARAVGFIGDNSLVPALIERLGDADEFVRGDAAVALGRIGELSVVPALIEVLKDEVFYARGQADYGLEKIVGKCETLEELGIVEKGIDEGLAGLRKGHVGKGILIDAQIKLAKLTREIAKRKDKFAPKRDLLLDDKPKPPKKGRGVYQVSRRIRNR